MIAFCWAFRGAPKPVKFISYPKTGSTWVRLLLGRYFQLLWSLDELILLEETKLEQSIFATHRAPALIVSHGALEWMTQTASDLSYETVVKPHVEAPVVVLTRHPLDALLSLYMHTKNQAVADRKPHIATFREFVSDPVMGLDKFIRFHNLWIEKSDLFVVRYEDLRLDTAREITRILQFIGADIDVAILEQAVNYASFENMRGMERGDSAPRFKSSGFRIFSTGDRGNPNAYHVREGRVGGYRDYLGTKDCALLLARIGRELSPEYGYAQ